MKKTIMILAVAAWCGAAQATILRVNNTTGSGAPYSDLNAAIEAAQEGDTIMVDGSSTNYGDVTISKTLVLIGPGYWRVENGVIAEGASAAVVSKLTVVKDAKGTVVRGMNIEGLATLKAPQTVINRCLLKGGLNIWNTADNCVIHQNFYNSGYAMQGYDDKYANYTQITNNIIITTFAHSDRRSIRRINEGYIAYNTFAYNEILDDAIENCNNCTIEKNIGHKLGNIASCSYIDNYTSEDKWLYTDRKTDLTIKNQKFEDAEVREAVADKGAFAGDDPYVISGIPFGAVIEDVTVPASVEQGQTLNVTVKLGVQK